MVKARIIVSGSLAFDRIMDFPGSFAEHILPEKLHVLNVSFHVREFRESYGGTAGNIAYALGRLGARPTVLATAGTDFRAYGRHLRAAGVDLRSVRIVKTKPTASVTIITDRDDNQIAGFFPGALARPFPPNEIRGRSALAIVAPGNLEDMKRLPRLFRRRGAPFIFDPGQQTVSLSSEALRQGMTGADVVIGNDYELALITKKSGWSKSKILTKSHFVVTTFGARGSVIEGDRRRIRIPAARPRRVVDPTGAGDAYRAGLLFGLSAGWPIERSARLGAVTATFAVEYYGTQPPALTRPNVFSRYSHFFHERL